MTPSMKHRCQEFRTLEGRQVSVALKDGSRIDDSQLVSAGRNGATSIWLYSNHVDVFVPLHNVVDLGEVGIIGGARAA